MTLQSIEAANIRLWFARSLEDLANLIYQSERNATQDGASGKLAVGEFAKSLNSVSSKLESGKFRFLIIGDFNRGKSTILNALFRQKLLPVGSTATTAIPTYVKYGSQREVIVHKKDGTTEKISLDEFRKRYTLNSEQVQDKISRFFDEQISKWLDPLDYAEFYFPLDLLAGGVEFIDTAGLNHTKVEDKKTLSYIKDCHVILFVLSAEQQFTDKEKEYLRGFISQKEELEDSEEKCILVPEESGLDEERYSPKRPIFYLINKWEIIDEEEREKVRKAFVRQFSKYFELESDVVDRMWGDSIFDVYAKDALKKVSKGEDFTDTGLDVFQHRLDSFLIYERLMVEISQANESASIVSAQVVEKIDYRLSALSEDVQTLEGKIKRATPHIEVMRKITQSLRNRVSDRSESCINKVVSEYTKYFLDLSRTFEKDFSMPPTHGLSDTERQEYTMNLKRKLAEYRQLKLDSWHEISKGIVLEYVSDLKDHFQDEISAYMTKREIVQEILSETSLDLENRVQVASYESSYSGDLSLSTAQAGAVTKMVMGATGGVVGTATAGIGAATAANVYAGTHILLATGLSLTPVGWALLGVSAVTGGVLAWWQRRSEVKKFNAEMQKRVKKEFEKLLDSSNILGIKENLEGLFIPFNDVATQMKNDINSLQNSFENLLEKKKSKSINIEKETPRLLKFRANVIAHLAKIKARYESIFSTVTQHK